MREIQTCTAKPYKFQRQAHLEATRGNRLARHSAFCSAGDACCLFKPLAALCRASVIPSALEEKNSSLQAAAPRVCGRSESENGLGESATRPSHWMGKKYYYGPITIEYTKPSNLVRPQLIHTEENLKKQVFLKRSHLINSSAFLTQVFANNKQVAHDP